MIKIWLYQNGKLINYKEGSEGSILDIETFKHLTGKRINWKIRESRKILTRRLKGRIRCCDEQFIVDEYYKHEKNVYRCKYVSEDGTALLVPRGNALKAVTARETKDWEIL